MLIVYFQGYLDMQLSPNCYCRLVEEPNDLARNMLPPSLFVIHYPS